MNKDMEVKIIAFIASIFCASTEGREPITQEEAWLTIKEWKAEGIELPRGLDAWAYAHYWNEFCEKEGKED